jgi:EAL domain-containing protein (putative c-di-GMP-specific phosphodiesterase class I)
MLALALGPGIDAAATAAAGTASAIVLGAIWAVTHYRRSHLIDESTGLPNLYAFEAASGSDTALLVVARLERFDAIARRLGAEAAARVISRVADRLVMANHERPVFRVDPVSLAWFEDSDAAATLEDRLEAITRLMRSPVDCGQLVDITLNLGMATCEGGNRRQALANAGAAASQSARKGLRWLRFSEGDEEDTDFNLSLLGELDVAMTSGQLWNAYQPKMDLATGRITGVEALVRWLHPHRGPIAPDNFVPLVEKHGRARDLTLHVLARALEDAAQWDASGLPVGISVNFSASLLADADFIELVRRALGVSGVIAERITLEISEATTLQDPELASAALKKWRASGVGISIDDYGLGQSLICGVEKLSATELKIDQSLIRDMISNEASAETVRSIVTLAHELGVAVVAQGIENAESLRCLTEMGCDTGQGYHIGRPMSASNLRVFLVGNAIEAA